MTKKQSTAVAKRKAFEVARDAEAHRIGAISDFVDAHCAYNDFLENSEEKDLNAFKAKIAALLNVEEDALDMLVAAHIAYRQALKKAPEAK
jgi:hypothetical protein